MDEEWVEAMTRFFKMVELRAHYWTIVSTPAIEMKRFALEKIEKELKSLMEE